jgi:ribosomal-protein-alanine N-acetyltransferase
MHPADLEPEAVSVRIHTARTIVRLAEPDDAPEVLRYYVDNREHLRPFDPERPPIFYEERFWRLQIRQNLEDYAADRALRLFLFPVDTPQRVIGNISFSNFVRGVAQHCTVGYSVDGALEGHGYMTESLRAALQHAFRSLNFHRIEANYMPHNVRSGRLLRGLGFVVEGYSRDYLKINGRWEDHVRTAILNPNWEG